MNQKDNKKFDPNNYALCITGKHIQVTGAIESYVKEKLENIFEKFGGHVIDVAVTLEVQKLSHKVNIVLKFISHTINVHSSTEDLYSAIDLAVDKLSVLIRKYKTKLLDHRADHLGSIDLRVNVLGKGKSETDKINELIDEENYVQEGQIFKLHEIVSHESMPLHLWTQEEAIMKLEISDKPFILYRGQEEQKLKVIYRRVDDEFAIIDIES